MLISPNSHTERKAKLQRVLELIFDHLTPRRITLATYRVGQQGVHLLQFDSDLALTLTDGAVNIPDTQTCLTGLQCGQLQIGVLDSVDITYVLSQAQATCRCF